MIPLSQCRVIADLPRIARSAYNVGLILILVVLPYMINPLEWNWQAKSGLFWGGTCVITLFWVIFRLPETKGRTPGALRVVMLLGYY